MGNSVRIPMPSIVYVVTAGVCFFCLRCVADVFTGER